MSTHGAGRDARSRVWKPLQIALLFGVVAAAAACGDSGPRGPDEGTATPALEPWTPELAEELRAMGAVDQEVRQGLGPETVTDTAFMARMVRADSAHSRRLRELVEAHGWPRSSEVGPEAAEAAFLIVQHTPFEEWQRSMLAHVERAVHAGEQDAQDYAMLYDRVQRKLGHPQRYGTQLSSTDDGRLRLDSLENPEAVDSLRAELGMPPLEEYLRIVEEAYGMEVER